MSAASYLGWMAVAAAAAAATSAALIGALAANTLATLAPEDRRFRDRPPRAFRCLWLPIRMVAPSVGAWLPARWKGALAKQLMLGGLDFAVNAEQFAAFVLLVAAFAAAATWFVTTSWHLAPLPWIVGASIVAASLPLLWLSDRIQDRRRDVHKSLPYVLDLITLCVEAGLTLQSGIAHAVAKGTPGPLRDELSRVLRDRRAGKTRVDALREMAARMAEPAVANLVTALIQSETLGMDLGPILRAQAEQRRQERFSRAEKLAMEAPVKMLLPLIMFIFPCTFIVLGFPIAIKFLRMGL